MDNMNELPKQDSKKKKNNKYLWSLLFVVIAVLTVWAVTSQNKDFSFSEFISFLGTLDVKYLICALVAMLGFIVFEALAIRTISVSFGYKRSLLKNYSYSSADIYFSAITPSASGGQPASALFMIQDGIPGAVVTVILLVNLVMYTFAILAIGVLCFILNPSVFLHFSLLSKLLIVAGCVAQIAIAFAFIMLLKHGDFLYKICSWFITLLAKLKLIKKIDAKREKLRHSIDTYSSYVEQIKGKKLMLLRAFVFNFLQRASLIAVTLFSFLAIGGDRGLCLDVWVAQSMVVLGSNTVPIPGAMGIADYLMLDVFGAIVAEGVIVNFELLSRSVSFYFCVITCGISFMTRCLISQFSKRRSEK